MKKALIPLLAAVAFLGACSYPDGAKSYDEYMHNESEKYHDKQDAYYACAEGLSIENPSYLRQLNECSRQHLSWDK